jgi:hypothetical protein
MSEGEGVAAPCGTRYQDQRRYVVAARLEDLEGPSYESRFPDLEPPRALAG